MPPRGRTFRFLGIQIENCRDTNPGKKKCRNTNQGKKCRNTNQGKKCRNTNQGEKKCRNTIQGASG